MSHTNPSVVKVRVEPLRALLEECMKRKTLRDLAVAVSRSSAYDEECAALEKHLSTITVDHAFLDE